MAVFIDSKNTWLDIQRMLWVLVPTTLAFVLGRLLCYYQRTQVPSTVVCEHTVLCNCPALPDTLPTCGIK